MPSPHKIFNVFRIFPNGKKILMKTFYSFKEAESWANLQLKYDSGATQDCTYAYSEQYIVCDNLTEIKNKNLRLVRDIK